MKKEFVIERNGKDYVLFAGLLDLAHDQGLKRIETTLVQIPNEMNGMVAIAHATAETERGSFDGIGDAAPNNVNRAMVTAIIRMAETRAKARALRDATNIGMVALEELPPGAGADDDDEPRVQRPQNRDAHQRRPDPTRQVAPPADDIPWPEPPTNGAPPPAALPANVDLAVLQERRATAQAAAPGVTTGDRAHQAPAQAARPASAGGPPITPKQIDTIKRMARAAGQAVPDNLEAMSRAQASELISALIGAMGEARAN